MGSDRPGSERLLVWGVRHPMEDKVMKVRLFMAAYVGAAFALAIGAGPAQANIVGNPGFETGAGADADAWNELEIVGGALGATAATDRVNAMPNTGDYSMFLDVVGAPDFGPVAEIQQQTPVGSVIPGKVYDFNFFSKGVAGPGSVGFYEVSWFDGDGSNGGGPQGSATGLQNYSLGAAYAANSQAGLIAPAGADSVFVQIRLVTGAFDGASGSAYIDDVSFTEIPEPASLALLGLGGLALARRRGS